MARGSLWVCACILPAFAQTVEFNRDIRPILSDKCFTCHGPDAPAKGIKLRLDVEGAAGPEVVRRISADDPARRMPPVWSGVKLTDREIKLLTQWINEGARWQKHWAWVPPRRPAVPESNPIDYFIHSRLQREGFEPSPEADRVTLIRRVSLDLTGLPPSPAEVDAFLSDNSRDAYEKVVDRLLASPRYGERMAIRWLDAARYADTNGYQTDAERHMWRWRDWVIEAFNRNMPFDRFTIEQIAGDLLPKATLDQKIATGFNRNHRGNSEGGIVPEEYLVEYAVDRVETMSTVFLGLTVGCARCHNHKYDPIAQREFYQLLAYFNNIPELGRYLKYGNTPPYVKAPTADQRAKLAALDQAAAEAERRFGSMKTEVESGQRRWEKKLDAAFDWQIREGIDLHEPLDNVRFDGSHSVETGNQGAFGFYQKFTASTWIRPDNLEGAIVTRAEDKPEGEGWGLHLKDGKLQVNLIKRWLDDSIRVETKSKISTERLRHVAMTYDGSRLAAGVRVYIDGEPQEHTVLVDAINQDFLVKEPLRIGAGGGSGARFRGEIDEVRLYRRVLSPDEIRVLATSRTVAEIAASAHTKRTQSESAKLRLAFLDQGASDSVSAAWREFRQTAQARDAYSESLPTVMVMEESPAPKETFLLIRGAYDRPGDKVSRGVPSALPPLPAGAPGNRLGLAQWLVDPANPLTARITVNRFWQMYFGTGLVKTVEDFGSQGEWPSHPELLDWLATEFLQSGWNVKALQKTIVMSATYRQSSKATHSLLNADPDNRLLARAPRLRLPAEMVRDQALFASGLLVEKTGGPSVKPYQPAGLWSELGGSDYERDRGEGLYRRSLYTIWKRTAPPPFMTSFDSALRESCTVRESRTNTPLQALNLMNDVTFLEASRMLAERAIREGGQDAGHRLAYAFRLVLARNPAEKELRTLTRSLDYYLDRYRPDRKAAETFLAQGDAPRDAVLDAAELAAYTAVASLILNLDEAITKE